MSWTSGNEHRSELFRSFNHTLLAKSNGRFFGFWFLKTFQSEECFQFWRQYNWVGVHFHKIKSGAKWLTQCVPRSKCDRILFFKIKFVLRHLLDLGKNNCIFVKISIPQNWHPYSMSAMFHGNQASCYDTVARKFRPSGAFERQYFLQRATISTTGAQRWRVVGTSMAGIKAAAIGRIFDIPGRTVRGIRAR